MDIKLTRKFEKQLSKLDKKTIDKILKKIYVLKYGVFNNNNVKHLTEYYPEYRLRIGGYRVLFDINGDIIIVQKLMKRGDDYKL